ncbi:hypothetical protein BC374_18335 [Ensifer sp. LC13]|nr:hypothetical protein BC362_26800 [Ensifer sp. LC14]OCP10309.1 hypothetical protein BC374_18335 [Ensifer sp. LC13]OCP11303.1 hypothetical protein BBX50_18545 [Ensifer sp. LC11]OCP33267.1 hypothetical protein BC364_17435 [Ensifer sp. LC499]
MDDAHSEVGSPEITWFSRVTVEGLHGRLDFSVNLNPNLNIIYGKNGRGKTTLLHILANLSELDFGRFNSLVFSRIEVQNNRGECVELRKSRDGTVSIYIDGLPTSYQSQENDISESEKSNIRKVLGDRPTYLPAFRSVLERTRDTYYGGYEERKHPQFDRIVSQAAEGMRLPNGRDGIPAREIDLARSVASKTIKCREWFGSFVPLIRYPSISDVIEGLAEEWRYAQLRITKLEQRQFEEAFLDIFSAIAAGDVDEDVSNQQDILASINDLLIKENPEKVGPTRNSTYDRLVEVAQRAGEADKRYNSLLEIYRRILSERKGIRETALKPLIEFESSVNKFLDEKKLRIGARGEFNSQGSARIRNSIVSVVSGLGTPYHLTALSSGERQIATMLYSASRSSFTSGAFLIDEPELSLHVDWQRIILSEIQQQHPDRQIIACTHSPEVGAEHGGYVQFFEPTSHVSMDDREVLEIVDDEGL